MTKSICSALCLTLSLFTTTQTFGQNLQATTYVSGLSSAIAIVQDPAKRNVQYVIEQGGLIKVVKDGVVQPTPFLDLTGIVLSGNEQGLLGLAFPPDYATSGKFYVNMTTPGPIMQVSQYAVSLIDPLIADSNSRHDILQTPRQNANHNCGTIQFGPDGYLYIPMGDGGGSGDQPNNAQNPNSWLGKMLRVDPSSDDFPNDVLRNYHVPANNPFVAGKPIVALKEIWAFGLRNPFKWSFDNPNLLGTGAMVIGDVGQDNFEEIDYQPAGKGGNNYGWKRFEGFSLFSGATGLAYGPDTRPAFDYPHTTGVTVIGGRVYRGLELGADYFGRYFFADFSNGRIWSMRFQFDTVQGRWVGLDLKEHTSEFDAAQIGSPSSIDVDSTGEIYIVDYNAKVSRISRANSSWVKEFTVQSGKVASGAVRNLVLIDNIPLQIETTLAQPKPMVLTAIGKTNVTSRVSLDIDAVGQLTAGTTGLLRVWVKRWADGQFVQVTAQNMDSVKRRFRLVNLSPKAFVRLNDGRIEVKLDVTRNGSSTAPVRAIWDQLLLKAS